MNPPFSATVLRIASDEESLLSWRGQELVYDLDCPAGRGFLKDRTDALVTSPSRAGEGASR